MRRTAQYQAQHPDPADLVHERGCTGQERRDGEPVGERAHGRSIVDGDMPSGSASARTASHTISASSKFSSPATRIVPGRPTAADEQESAHHSTADGSAEAVVK